MTISKWVTGDRHGFSRSKLQKLKVSVAPKVIVLTIKISLEVVGRDLSPYSHVPTYDPTQRLRGNPITLNLYIYNNILIYIVFCLKDLFELKISIVLKDLITSRISTQNIFLIENNFLYDKF